jgi:hypothetical protein
VIKVNFAADKDGFLSRLSNGEFAPTSERIQFTKVCSVSFVPSVFRNLITNRKKSRGVVKESACEWQSPCLPQWVYHFLAPLQLADLVEKC